MQEELSDIDLGWLAGILEGEGYFAISDSSPQIKLGMTDKDIVYKVSRLMNTKTNVNYRKSKNLNHKDHYTIQINGYDAFQWMLKLKPLMGLRRGHRIDEVLKETIRLRPNIILGKGYCHNGHSVRFPNEYYLDSNGSKGCRACKRKIIRVHGIRVRSNTILVSPFEKVG